MRNAARLVLGFYPLPEDEATRLQQYLRFPPGEFSALDPCVGDGLAFQALLGRIPCHRYGIELDTLRAESASAKTMNVVHGDALEVHCPAESVSLLYLNPPYDFEVGSSGNRRFEELFLRHTYRWLKRSGVLVLVIPQRQLVTCSALLAEYFTSIRVYRLTSPACIQYHQVAVLACRRTTLQNATDRQHCTLVSYLQALAEPSAQIPDLGDTPDAPYQVPASATTVLTNRGVLLDVLEDLLPGSNAYRQAGRVLLRQPNALRGRPITQLHGGHVALLAASGALNGVFGHGADRHMATWTPARMFHHSVQKEDDGSVISRKWSSFSPKLLLLYEDGRTKVLSHKKSKTEADDDGQHELPVPELTGSVAPAAQHAPRSAAETTPPPARRRTIRRRIDLRKS